MGEQCVLEGLLPVLVLLVLVALLVFFYLLRRVRKRKGKQRDVEFGEKPMRTVPRETEDKIETYILTEELDVSRSWQEVHKANHLSVSRDLQLEKEKAERLADEVKSVSEELKKEREQTRDLRCQLDSLSDVIQEERRAKEVALSSLAEERRAKDDALLRLSEVASNRLRNNNPNIADLSDENRPTKLGEKCSELYDNQWTEAFEALTDGQDDTASDKEFTDALLQILMVVLRICQDKAADKLKALCPHGGDFKSLPTDTQVQLKDQRRKEALDEVRNLAEDIQSVVAQRFQAQSWAKLLVEERLQDYIRECVSLCYLMSVQDPPMAFQVDPGEEDDSFNSGLFRAYTKTGPYVDYLVWPALLLQDGGSLVCKGVAQCCQHQAGVAEPDPGDPSQTTSF